VFTYGASGTPDRLRRVGILLNAGSGAARALTYEIVCSSCGTPLYSGFDLRSPGDVLKAADYKCRKCGTKLSPTKFEVDVRKIDGSFS
jgi:DNA-directed RNA polymerase subunit RPC12/RpoP